MITTITLNPAIDKTILLGTMIRGGVNRIISAREDIGGKGINVAKLLNRLDIKSQASGFIGSGNKKKVFELLELENLSYHFVEIDAITRTNTKVVELEAGLTTDINEQGFTVNDEQLQELKNFISAEADSSKFIVFSGSLPIGLPVCTYKDLISLVKGKTLTALDVDAPYLIEGVKASPFLIKPNIHELETAFNVTLRNDEEVEAFCKKLISEYGIGMILVSMGGDGSLLVTKDETLKAMPIRVDVKSTVGAGDSMLAGMIYGLVNGLSNKDALAYATACGTLAVTKEGTQSFSKEEISEMLKKVIVQ